MRIGFDAKRAFFNNTGLGNYSRNTLRQLFIYYPNHQYYLYTPSQYPKVRFHLPKEVIVRTPDNIFGKIFKSYWRSFLVSNQLIRDKLSIYHGLSNELPFGITETKLRSVVTIHDLIFKRFPQWYKPIDVKIYDRKFQYAATYADIVIAVSKQTAADIKEFYGIDEKKIRIIYQNCNPLFYELLPNEKIDEIKVKYNLPKEYLLYVGTIEERKNLHVLIEALGFGKIDFPLVAIGRKTSYFKDKVLPMVQQYRLESSVIFIENIDNKELPAIYQGAKVFIYPSLYEGFGIPILEAQASGVPVVTSRGGCFEETGGMHSFYVNPRDSEELAHAIQILLSDKQRRIEMIEKGRQYSKNFIGQQSIQQLHKVYEELA